MSVSSIAKNDQTLITLINMENKLSEKEIDDIMQKINHPFSKNLEIKTDKDNIQWAYNLGDDGSYGKKFELLYNEFEEKLADGVYSSLLFEEGFVAASVVARDAAIPLQSNKPFIKLKRNKI